MKMKKSKRVLVSLFSAALLAGAGSFVTNEVQQQHDPQAGKVQAASYINDYINSQQFGNPQITTYNSSFTNYFGYENGVGRPEGIVVHETANPNSTIDGEVSYMMNNWNSIGAYVHAFVDHSRIINIHPTDYAVWGAGPQANKRFIQIELVREHSTDNFARSINNDAYYVAYLLKQYGLYPSLADNTGSGTVWSHNAVSYWLGGTNHTDPVGYFSQWGYDMNQFYAMVEQKYGELTGNGGGGGTVAPSYDSPTSISDVSKRAVVHGNANNGVYYLINNQFQSFGSSMDYDGQPYDVYQIAKTKNGVEMALIGSGGNPALWINAKNLEYTSADKVKDQSSFVGTAKMNPNVQTYYYINGGFTGADRFGNQNVKIQQRITTTDGKIYYLVQTNRDLRWVRNYDLSGITQDKITNHDTYNGTAWMSNGQTYYFNGSGFDAAEDFGGENVTIQQRIQTQSGAMYYLVSTSRGDRWVQSNTLSNIVSDAIQSIDNFGGTGSIGSDTQTYYNINGIMTKADIQGKASDPITKVAKTSNGKTFYLFTRADGDWRWINADDVTIN
ncbi:MAG: N-acetylmuramoyl-L-alanine amidase [Lactobacillus sp.]|jgi:bifunctional autolysin|nr:N-acetylmuramoyl-L-alanine amidase [Lactobacillus sp.]